MRKLNIVEKDALQEVGSIGSGNASSILSNLTGKEVTLTVTHTDIVPIKEIPKLILGKKELVTGPKKLVVGVYSQISGDVRGNITVIFSKESALLLSDLLQKKT